jgi:RNA polymerase sigma-70 factor (ECF subfamily)
VNLDEKLLEDYRYRLRVLAARRLHDWTEAEDVAQEAIRRTLDALSKGRVSNPAALPAFLFQTAIHICQHRARALGMEKRALEGYASSVPTSEPVDPLQFLLSAERRAEVRAALDSLALDDREVLTLTYTKALSTRDIARRLNLSEGNVRVRRHRALTRLAELLDVTGESTQGLKS